MEDRLKAMRKRQLDEQAQHGTLHSFPEPSVDTSPHTAQPKSLAPYKPSVYVYETTLPDGKQAICKEILIAPSITGEEYLQAKERIERQIQIGEQLEHPHHTKLLGHEQENNRTHRLFYSVAPGQTIESLLAQRSLSTDEILTITEQLAKALAYCHDLHPPILHNDVTPANVCYDATLQHTTLYDYDAALAELLLEGQLTTRVLGTPGYVAPEVREGKMPTHKSDIYGLGGLLKFMLTGKHPDSVSDEILQRNVPNKSLVELVSQLTYENPEERYSALETIHMVQKIRVGQYENKKPKENYPAKIKQPERDMQENRNKTSSFVDPFFVSGVLVAGGILSVGLAYGLNNLFTYISGQEKTNTAETQQVEIQDEVEKKITYMGELGFGMISSDFPKPVNYVEYRFVLGQREELTIDYKYRSFIVSNEDYRVTLYDDNNDDLVDVYYSYEARTSIKRGEDSHADALFQKADQDWKKYTTALGVDQIIKEKFGKEVMKEDNAAVEPLDVGSYATH